MSWNNKDTSMVLKSDLNDLSTSRINASQINDSPNKSVYDDLRAFDSFVSKGSEFKENIGMSNYQTGDTMNKKAEIPQLKKLEMINQKTRAHPLDQSSLSNISNSFISTHQSHQFGYNRTLMTSFSNQNKFNNRPFARNFQHSASNSRYSQNLSIYSDKNSIKGFRNPNNSTLNAQPLRKMNFKRNTSYTSSRNMRSTISFNELKKKEFDVENFNKEKEINRGLIKISKSALVVLQELKTKIAKIKEKNGLKIVKKSSNKEEAAMKEMRNYKQDLIDRYNLLF